MAGGREALVVVEKKFSEIKILAVEEGGSVYLSPMEKVFLLSENEWKQKPKTFDTDSISGDIISDFNLGSSS